ncbi:MAG TPA: ATP-binding protein [Candidatus Aminicenantes bacterium]|nr:ATP-binding protein [Candidatus Aminicenantes bacterium]
MPERCPLCRETGWVIHEKDGHEYAEPCECQAMNRLIAVEKRLNIPARFQGTDLRGFAASKPNSALKQVIVRVKRFVNDYPAVDKGLLFQGDIGVGKTKMLCAIAGELLNRRPGMDLYYIDWNDLVREMRSGEDHSSRDFSTIHHLVQRLARADLLLFDEVGASRVSPWVQDNIYYIINRRYNAGRLTCCATNFYDESADGGETLEQRLGLRIRSRLFEMTQALVIPGTDYRRRWG